MYKTHTCGEVTSAMIGQTVTLAGWVHRYRDHGGVHFVDLRDRFGVIQLVAAPDVTPRAHEVLDEARQEWVVQVTGVVEHRPAGMENAKMPNGDIEIAVREAEVLNPSKPLPFSVNNSKNGTDENLRLKYRYLDLRREKMLKKTIF